MRAIDVVVLLGDRQVVVDDRGWVRGRWSGKQSALFAPLLAAVRRQEGRRMAKGCMPRKVATVKVREWRLGGGLTARKIVPRGPVTIRRGAVPILTVTGAQNWKLIQGQLKDYQGL